MPRSTGLWLALIALSMCSASAWAAEDDSARRRLAVEIGLLESMDLRLAYLEAKLRSDGLAEEERLRLQIAAELVRAIDKNPVSTDRFREMIEIVFTGSLGDATRQLQSITATSEPAFVDGLPLAESGATVEAVLDNGLRVTIVGDPILSLAAVVIRVGSGAAVEVAGERGAAHVLEHLMFAGTKAWSEQALWDAIDQVGGSANAFTGHDDTTYVTRIPPSALKRLLDLEADRFQNLVVAPDALARERTVVAEEIRLRNGIDPRMPLELALHEGILDGHPYGRSVGGTIDEVAALVPESVQTFYDSHYVASNTTVVIVSPIEPRALFAEVEARFATMVTGEAARSLDAVDSSDRRVGVRGPGAMRNGLAWTLPAGRPCGPDDGFRAACTRTYWTDRVVLKLLLQDGVGAVQKELARQTLSVSDVEASVWQGAAGGYVLITADLKSKVGIAAHNTGGVFLVALAGIGGGTLYFPFRSNPTPARLMDSLLADSGEWITEEAINRAREHVIQEELRRMWDPQERALATAEKVSLGLGVDDSVIEELAGIRPEDVLYRYREIIRGEAQRVHIR